MNPNYILPKMFMMRLQKLMDEYAGGVSAQFTTSEKNLEKALELLAFLKEDCENLAASRPARAHACTREYCTVCIKQKPMYVPFFSVKRRVGLDIISGPTSRRWTRSGKYSSTVRWIRPQENGRWRRFRSFLFSRNPVNTSSSVANVR